MEPLLEKPSAKAIVKNKDGSTVVKLTPSESSEQIEDFIKFDDSPPIKEIICHILLCLCTFVLLIFVLVKADEILKDENSDE